MNRARIYQMIDFERDRQEVKWNRPHRWGHGSCASTAVPDPVKAMVLTEKVGEVMRAVLDGEDAAEYELRDELVQVAAVCIAWLEALT